MNYTSKWEALFVNHNYDRMRDLREDRELTQKDVALYLNIAQRTYSGYETRSRNIPIDILIELAYFYNTSVDYLLGITDESMPHKRRQKKSLCF